MASAADRLDEALDDPNRRPSAIPHLVGRFRVAEKALREIAAVPLYDRAQHKCQRIANDALVILDSD